METERILDEWEKFKELTTEEMVNAVKRGMRKAAKTIKEGTLNNARAGIKTYNNHSTGEYENGNILDAVRVTGIRDEFDEEKLSMKVHVMGYSQPPNKTFRFRFLELGTKDRYATTKKGKELKKPRYLGKIQPRKYFNSVIDSIDVEPIYMEEIQKAIDRINQ